MLNKRTPPSAAKTSWEPVQKWYHGLVGEEGHYYHRQIILPGVLRLLGQPKSVLDLGCGNGILARYLPKETHYMGIDAAPSLIKAAKKNDTVSNHQYLLADITKPFKLEAHRFSHATLILAAQNLEFPLKAFQNAKNYLEPGGKFILVVNHPCFRIPRQSSWEIDENKKIQYRRLDRYLTSLKIPIQAHPGKGELSPSSVSFHYPLSSFAQWLSEAGFAIDWMEEWCSDKVSIGKAAKMENRAREEFPLFLAIRAVRTLTKD